MAIKRATVDAHPGAPSVTELRRRQQQADDVRVNLIENAVITFDTRDEYAKEIGRLWGEAQQKLVLIGRYLIRAKESLPHGEFEEMVRRELPFQPSVARMLRTVAERIEAGVIPPDRVPSSYATAYQLVTLTPEEIQAAQDRGLVRPDVTRNEVVTFKRSLRERDLGANAIKQQTLERYRALQRRLQDRIAALERELNILQIDGDHATGLTSSLDDDPG